MRRLAAILLAVGLLLLAATFAGPLHPAGDSLAVGRPVLAAGLLALGLVQRGALGWIAVLAGGLALAPMIWDARPRAEVAPVVTVYQKNLLFRLEDPAAVIADIRAQDPDLVLLAELSPRNLALPEALADSLPHQAICPAYPVGAVAVLSRWPLDGGDCREGMGALAVRVASPSGPLTVAALHLHWPWPSAQQQQVQQLLPWLAALPQPALVGGDFNAVPGSRTVRRIEAATGTARAGPLRPTFLLQDLLPISIDHVLVPQGWSARGTMRPELGSDHRGQLVTTARP